MIEILLIAIFLPMLWAGILSFSKGKVLSFAGLISAAITACSFFCIYILYKNVEYGQASLLSLQWAPSLNVDLSFIIDGLSLFFGFLVTGVGTLVNIYAQYYMDKEDPYLKRFYILLNLFTTCMLGCVFSDNLLLLFLFWELTGVTSFLLIGYFFTNNQSIVSARMVFLLTSLTSLSLLVGILMIGNLQGTFRWTDIVTHQAASNEYYWIILLFMIAIFGKSAQIPFHFWLPNAMCAPTPISAYLHSATMVKLGVFLTARMYPIFVTDPIWFPLVVTVCLSTMLLGAVLSLISNELKKILAYATVSQLGFFIAFYGMGDVGGVSYDFIHILNHAFYKGSLFMLVGIIAHATGFHNISKLGGLWKSLPATMVIFFISTLAMAGIPGTTGFISKELVLKDLLIMEGNLFKGGSILTLIIFASIFKVAFSIRLFYHLFIRDEPGEALSVHKPNWKVLIAPAILSTAALGFGIWPSGLETIARNFYVSGLHIEELPNLKIWHGWTSELTLSFLIYIGGALLFYFAQKGRVWTLNHHLINFAILWNQLMDNCVIWAEKITKKVEGKSLQRDLAIVVLSFTCAIGGVLAYHGAIPWKRFIFHPTDPVKLTSLLMIAATSFGVIFLKTALSRVLSLAASGFFVTLYFVFFMAPDLAITQILVEVVTGIMLLILVWVLKEETEEQSTFLQRALRFVCASVAAVFASAIALAIADLKIERPLADYFLASSIPLAKGANAVNTLLIDFRGLDTLGEITVLLIAAFAIIGIVRKEKLPDSSDSAPIRLIPSYILKKMSLPLFFMINLFALYLLIRGHDKAGGGFIGGIASAISFILLGFSLQFDRLKKLLPINLLLLAGSGLALSLSVSVFPIFLQKPFLTHHLLQLPTPLLFDIGVFIVVFSITLISIFTLREDALKQEPDNDRR